MSGSGENGSGLTLTTLLVTETTRSVQRRPGWWWPLIGMAALLALLFAVGQIPLRHRIENDLERAVRSRFLAKNVQGFSVDVRGRDAHVRGQVPNATTLAEIQALVAGTKGVRTVHTAGVNVGLATPGSATLASGSSVPVPPLPSITQPGSSTTLALTLITSSIDLKVVGDPPNRRIRLIGRVPSAETRDTIVAAAAAAVGAGNVEDNLVVDRSVGPLPAPMQEGIGALIAAASEAGLRDGHLSIVNDVLTVGGTAVDEPSRRRLGDAAVNAVNDPARRRDQTQLAPPLSTTSTLGGTVSSGAVADATTSAPTTGEVGTPTTPSAPGTTVAPTAAGQALQRLVAFEPITFVSGSARLTPQGLTVVQRAAQVLRDNPSVNVRVEGHTDDKGLPRRNERLSQQRALVVRQTLIALGIATDRLDAAGFGQSQPIADNATPEGRAKNRRIEFVVVGRAS